MANYGTQTVGGVAQDIEVDVQGLLITLPGSESILSAQAYLQTTNGSTADVKCALYNSSTLALVYESDQFTFNDDTGGWKTITWPATTPTAGSYYLTIAGGFISGGTNTVNLFVATVTASANYRRAAGGALSYPTLPNPFVPDNATHDQNPSLYLVTSSGGGGGSTRVKNRRLRMGFQAGARSGF